MPEPLIPTPDYGDKVTKEEDQFFSELAGAVKTSGVNMMSTPADEELLGRDFVDPASWVGDDQRLKRKNIPGEINGPFESDSQYRPSLNAAHPYITSSSIEPKTHQELATVVQSVFREPHVRQFLKTQINEPKPSPEAMAKLVHALSGVLKDPDALKGPLQTMITRNWQYLTHSASTHVGEDIDIDAAVRELKSLQTQAEETSDTLDKVKAPGQAPGVTPTQNQTPQNQTPQTQINQQTKTPTSPADQALQRQQFTQTQQLNKSIQQLNQNLKKIPSTSKQPQSGGPKAPVAPKAPLAPKASSFQDPTHVAYLSNPMMLWDQQSPFYPGSQYNEMSYDPRPNVFDNTSTGYMEGYGKKPADKAIQQDPFLKFPPADPDGQPKDGESSEAFKTMSALVDDLVDGLKKLQEEHPELENDIEAVYDRVAHDASSHIAHEPNDLPQLPPPPEDSTAKDEQEMVTPDDVKQTPILRAVNGMVVVVENPAGSIRKGVSKDGIPWSRQMTYDYGFISHYCNTDSCQSANTGADDEHIDCFIGPRLDSQTVFVINQIDPDTREFDEHKVMLGFLSLPEAIDGYLSNYPEDWQGLDGVQVMRTSEFKTWLASQPELLKKPITPRGWGDDPVLNAGDGEALMPELHPGEGDDSFFDDYPDTLHRVDTLPGRVSPLGLESKYNTDPWLESMNPMTAQGTRFFLPGPRFNKPNSGIPGYAFTRDH